MNSWRKYAWYLPAAIVAIVIALLSLWEHPTLPPLVLRWSDKTWHTLMYVVQAVALLLPVAALGKERRKGLWVHYAVAWVLTAGYGGLMEVLQATCTRTRTGDWIDFVADMVGATIGLALVAIYRVVRKRVPSCE
ncbi:MAG: VanZ family protein [Paludibacteraceae bacterium]